MNRKEQIEKVAKETFGLPLSEEFVQGAEWADENPKSKYNLSDVDLMASQLDTIINAAERMTTGNMANYKNQTGISFIIAEKEDGTYDVNMGSNADLPQDGLPVKLYTGIMQAVCDYMEEHNTKKTCSCSDPKLIERMLVVIKKIAQTKQEVNKASNQIAAYEIGQQMGKLIDELVSLYAEMEQK